MNRFVAGPLFSLALVSGGAWLSAGCVVPQARLEEARSAMRVEQEAHRRTQEHLGEISRKLEQVHAALDEREQRLATLEAQLSESRLSEERAELARRYAIGLVEQLRGELERTGGHLREFAEDKQKLASALDAAQAREKRLARCEQDAADNALIVRDLTLALNEPIATGEVELSVVDGRATLRLPSSELAGETPEPLGLKVLTAVARITQIHPESRVRLAEDGAPPESSEGAAARLRAVSDKLAARGLAAQRVELDPTAPASAGESTLVIGVYVTSGSVSAAKPASAAAEPAGAAAEPASAEAPSPG